MNIRKSVIAIVLTAALVLPGAALAADMEMKDMTEMNDMKDMTEMKDTGMNEMDMKDMDMKETDMMEMSDAYKGVNTMTKRGIEYVELRQLVANLGYMLEWNAMTKVVTISIKAKDDMMSMHKIELKAGVMSITVDGKMHKSDKPMVVKGRTYITKTSADMYITQMME